MSVPFPRRAAVRWGHWGAQLLIAAIVAAIALRLRPPPPGSPAALMLPLAILAFVLVSWLMMRQHDRRLCERCIAGMPLDAAARAARYRIRFDIAHLGSNRPLVLAYLALLIGVNFIPGSIGAVIWTLTQTTMIYLVLAYSTHRRLQPWCPHCRGGGGHDDEVVTPDPLPHGGLHV